MTTNGCVTIYAYDEESGEYTSAVYPASVFRRTNDGENSGIRREGECTVRIPTSDAVTVTLGDLVYIGIGEREPDKDKCLTVVGITDNRRGSANMRHWRLEAK